MNRWRFRFVVVRVGKPDRIAYLRKNGEIYIFHGTAAAALAFPLKRGSRVTRVEIESIGIIEREPSRRMICEIRERRDNRGWNIEPLSVFEPWHYRSIEAGVAYYLRRLVGHVLEIRIIDQFKQMTNVVLCDRVNS